MFMELWLFIYHTCYLITYMILALLITYLRAIDLSGSFWGAAQNSGSHKLHDSCLQIQASRETAVTV